MAMTVADQLLERLREWGVHRIYGYPGDGINAILGALDAAGNDPELIRVRHEEVAAFMACAHAKFSGQVGVCLATSGPGAIHLLNGLYDAKLDHQPVVAIVGQQVAILVGQGARSAADELVEVAEVLGAGVAKALLGKDVLPDDLPFVTGSIGLLGTKPSYDLMMGCDTFLMVGSSLPYSQFLPEYGQARAVQIDIDPRMIGIRYPMEVNLVGDARETLGALLPLLRRKQDRAWRQEIEAGVADWWELMEA